MANISLLLISNAIKLGAARIPNVANPNAQIVAKFPTQPAKTNPTLSSRKSVLYFSLLKNPSAY